METRLETHLMPRECFRVSSGWIIARLLSVKRWNEERLRAAGPHPACTLRERTAGPTRGSPAPCCRQRGSPAAGLRRAGTRGLLPAWGCDGAQKRGAGYPGGRLGSPHAPSPSGGCSPYRAAEGPQSPCGRGRSRRRPPGAAISRRPQRAPAPHGGRGEAGPARAHPLWPVQALRARSCSPWSPTDIRLFIVKALREALWSLMT